MTVATIILALERTDCKGLKFFCVYCKREHLHGEDEGHRTAHCSNLKSPYLETGYILKRKTEI